MDSATVAIAARCRATRRGVDRRRRPRIRIAEHAVYLNQNLTPCRTGNDELEGRFRPIVDAAMQQVGATRDQQALLDTAGPITALVDSDELDLSGYVTDGALAGVYRMIGEEEQEIRASAAARSTGLLKKVFGR